MFYFFPFWKHGHCRRCCRSPLLSFTCHHSSLSATLRFRAWISFIFFTPFKPFLMAKQVKMEEVDMVSKLPDSILSHILSFLPMKEAVGTSVLSTKWRYLFTLLPNLDFELNEYTSNGADRLKSSTIESFKSVIGRTFSSHTIKVDKFRLQCGKSVGSNCIRKWISAAALRGVKYLDLNIYIARFTLPDPFTCSTLVTLKLNIQFVLNVANGVCLPNLKTLHLRPLTDSDDQSVKSLVSCCISLEHLVLENHTMKNIDISHNLLKRLTILGSENCSLVTIDTPAVAYFKYSDHVAKRYSLNLKSLVEADVDFDVDADSLFNREANAVAATSFFEGINTAQSFNLSFNSFKLLSRGVNLPIFPKLVRLKICSESYCYHSERGLSKLLTNFYELEELAFNQEVLTPLPKTVPNCVMFTLEVIEISRFLPVKICIEKAKYFLENARALKKLIIRTTQFISEENKLKIFEELSASPRQSNECCILIV